jgi:hypothetical protein
LLQECAYWSLPFPGEISAYVILGRTGRKKIWKRKREKGENTQEKGKLRKHYWKIRNKRAKNAKYKKVKLKREHLE